MKTKIELDEQIISITAKIHREYPELSEHISEIPIKDSESEEEIKIKNLEDYYNSLKEIVNKYAETHKSKSR